MSRPLFLLRHAHAGEPGEWAGPDATRPLTAKGRRQAELLGAHLAARPERAPDLYVTSPRVRAHETATLAAAPLGTPVVVDARLGGGVGLEVLEAVLVDAGPAARPCIVGHEPDLSGLLADLLGGAAAEMRKGTLALVDAPRPLVRGRAVLRLLLPPDELPRG